MNAKLTSREIAAMKALPAAIKVENSMPTLHVFPLYAEIELRTPEGQTVAVLSPHFSNIARRMSACWNACANTPTETLEACASWADIVKAPMVSRHYIPPEAAAVGAVLDPEALEQGEVL